MKKSRTYLQKTFIIFVVTLFVQIIVFAGAMKLLGGVKDIRNDAYKTFHAQVEERCDELKEYMSEKQRIATLYKNRIEADISKFMQEQGRQEESLNTDNDLNEMVLSEISSDMVELMKMGRTSGAFIVLNGYSMNSELRRGIYVRNSEYEEANEKHFSLLRGSTEIAKKMNLGINANWRSDFRISDSESSDYYRQIYNVVEQHPEYLSSNLGYWSKPMEMFADNESVLLYSMPLLDEKNQIYGVMGIDINMKKIKEMLPHSELNTEDTGYYVLGIGEEGTTEYDVCAYSANENQKFLAEGDRIESDGKMVANFNYQYYVIGKDKKLVGNSSELKLYDAQSLFENQKWMLIGVQEEKDLLKHYNRVFTQLCISLLITVLAGMFGVVTFAVNMCKKVRRVMFFVKDFSPDKKLQISSTNIRELDMLASSIEELGARMGASATKLTEIIDMVKIPVGAVEYREDGYVYCTGDACEILELHPIGKKNQYIKRETFDKELDAFRKKLIPYEEEDAYYVVSKDGEERWIRLKTKEHGGRRLMAVLDISKEVREKQKIEYERDYDILTRLLNRNAFRTRMSQLLSKGNLGIAALVMYDLDNLKYFNDTYGHDYGDKYIREAASVFSSMSRYNALVGRMSGDEFLIFIYGYSNKNEIRELISKLHRRLKEATIWVPSKEHIKLRASAGIAWYPDDGIYMDELLKYADFAMYEIKGTIKGNIKEFNRETYLKDAVLFTGKEELNRLIDEPGMVRYAFQPIVDAMTGEIYAYEALMRPQIESLRAPEDVMRLAKAQSKLYQIEYMTWRAALSEVERQRKQGDIFKIFINSVPNHVLEDVDSKIISETYGELLNRVVIEIIENEQTDTSCMDIKRDWARQHNAQVALDDFGMGYSNESTLLYINPDYVKIDISIISNIHLDEHRQNLVQNLLHYTKTHGIKVIAEGIDNFEEMDMLISFGVDYMQGWYLARAQYDIVDLRPDLKEQIRQCARKHGIIE